LRRAAGASVVALTSSRTAPTTASVRARTRDRYRPPLVITALGSPAPVVERVHAYGGLVDRRRERVALAASRCPPGGRAGARVRRRRRPHRPHLAFAFVPARAQLFTA